MRAVRTAILFGLVLCLAAAPAALAVPRIVLVESFTNVSCPYCPAANTATRQFMTQYGPRLAVGVQYHVNWPGGDPFNVPVAADVDAYRLSYGVTGVPSLFSDGQQTSTGSVPALVARADERLLADSPFALSVTKSSDGGNVTVEVTVEAIGAPPAGDLVLRIVLVETEIHLATAPGTNGEKDFYDTLRKMLPDHQGTTFSMSEGGWQTFSQTTPLDPGWNYDNLRAVAWVRAAGDPEVLQAASSAGPHPYAFYYSALESGALVALGDLHSFPSVLLNAGQASDTYDVHITRNLPANWSGTVCARGVCYPPWTEDFSIACSPGALDTIAVDIQPLIDAGQGTMTLTATSRGDPTQVWSRTFKVVSHGLPILIVDNDGGHAYETFYTAALDAGGRRYGVWGRAAYGDLTTAELDRFLIVIWIAGLNYPPLGDDDLAAVGGFLDHGGRLLVSGQDVGWALCDPASSYYSPERKAWYQYYLGADYVVDDTNDASITGVAGDPIGDGLSITLTSSGDNKQTMQDEIHPRAGAVGFLLYSANREAGVRYEHANFKTVTLGYGFEGQTPLSSRTLLLNRSMTWFGVNLVDVPAESGLPYLAAGPRACPNPFNPATVISFALDGQGTTPAKVELFDVRGRRVRTLWDGPLAAGERWLAWDGRDERGAALPSGLYLARVRAAGQERTLKLMLAK